MRVSFTAVSVHELFDFNLVVSDILRDIEELMTLPENSELTLRFYKDEQDASVYESQAKFEDASNGELTYDPVILKSNNRMRFKIPSGCNLADVFNWLYSEIANFAFVMSQGQILPDASLYEGVSIGKEDGVFEMVFLRIVKDVS